MEEAMENPACVPMASDVERIVAIKEANKLLEEVQVRFMEGRGPLNSLH